MSLATGEPGTSGRAASAQQGFGKICGASRGWVLSAEILSPVYSSRNLFPLTVALLSGKYKEPPDRSGLSLIFAISRPKA